MDLNQVKKRERFYKNNSFIFGNKDETNQWPLGKQSHIDVSECPICLESFVEKEKLVRLKCLHVYHEDCLEALLRYRTECSLCKKSIDI